jgi:hypothetical protein
MKSGQVPENFCFPAPISAVKYISVICVQASCDPENLDCEVVMLSVHTLRAKGQIYQYDKIQSVSSFDKEKAHPCVAFSLQAARHQRESSGQHIVRRRLRTGPYLNTYTLIRLLPLRLHELRQVYVQVPSDRGAL